MLCVWPAIVSDPPRGGPVFTGTSYLTTPFPVPLAPSTILIHASLLTAVHVQVLGVDTKTRLLTVP
jgi:hypothetical protein